MGCIVSKLFLDFYIFFIYTRPLSGRFDVCSKRLVIHLNRLDRLAADAGRLDSQQTIASWTWLHLQPTVSTHSVLSSVSQVTSNGCSTAN